MLARILDLLGVHLGGEDQHLRASQANPTGFWEHRGLVRINNELLARFGGDWAGPPYLPPGWERGAELEPFRERAREELGTLRAAAPVVGFKDPRLCLLLPFWREVTDIDHVVASVRPPRAVIQSLQRRNGLSDSHVAALYSRYVSSLIAEAPDLLLVDYHGLMRGSREVVDDLARRLGLGAPDDDVLAAIATFVRPDLDHGQDGASIDAGPPSLDLALEVHQRLADLPEARPWFRSMAETLNEVAASDGRAPGGVGARATALAAARAELDAERRSRTQLHTEQLALESELLETRREHAELVRAHRRLRERRSVRAALALASLAAPAVRLLRRLRRVRPRG